MNIVEIDFKQGCTFTDKVVYLSDGSLTTANLTGATAKLEFRTNYSDPSPIITLTSSPPFGIVLTPSDPSFTISMTPAQTLSFPSGPGWYDMLLTLSGGGVIPLMEGVFRCYPVVTR